METRVSAWALAIVKIERTAEIAMFCKFLICLL
jgi:hypothetical protein